MTILHYVKYNFKKHERKVRPRRERKWMDVLTNKDGWFREIYNAMESKLVEAKDAGKLVRPNRYVKHDGRVACLGMMESSSPK